MSEVKRYGICGFEGGVIELKDGHLVHVDDFDRVTADADRLRAELECSRGDFAQLERISDALQQRLTAADERADLQGSALARIHDRCEAFIEDERDMPIISVEVIRDIAARAALKPEEAAKCARCECSTVESCDERGCGFLGSGNGAP